MTNQAAGELTERFSFQKRATVAGEGYGNFEGAWTPQFTYWARRQMLKGGENVMAARLQGRQPSIITVRSSGQTRQITSDWRAVDQRNADVWNIRSVSPSEERDYIDLLCERGVADG